MYTRYINLHIIGLRHKTFRRIPVKSNSSNKSTEISHVTCTCISFLWGHCPDSLRPAESFEKWISSIDTSNCIFPFPDTQTLHLFTGGFPVWPASRSLNLCISKHFKTIQLPNCDIIDIYRWCETVQKWIASPFVSVFVRVEFMWRSYYKPIQFLLIYGLVSCWK